MGCVCRGGLEEEVGGGRPSEEGEVILIEPGAHFGGAGGDETIFDGFGHFGEAEVVAGSGKALQIVFAGVGVGGIEPDAVPIGGSEQPDASVAAVLVEHLDEITDGDFDVIALKQVEIHVIGLEAIETFDEVAGKPFGRTERGVSSPHDEGARFPNVSPVQPVTEQSFRAVSIAGAAGVECISAGFEEGVAQGKEEGCAGKSVCSKNEAGKGLFAIGEAFTRDEGGRRVR